VGFAKVITEAQEKVRNYATASLHYIENALLMIRQGETEKASELLWGSVAEALQALAISRGVKPLKNHKSLRWFVGVISRELDDSDIAKTFHAAENLHHKGFHEVELELRDVALLVEPIRKMVKRLLDSIPKELLRAEDIQRNDKEKKDRAIG
jgi:hypothetical protein